MWRKDDGDARANLAIENMAFDAQEDALFDLLREEAVPLPSPLRSSSSYSATPALIRR